MQTIVLGKAIYLDCRIHQISANKLTELKKATQLLLSSILQTYLGSCSQQISKCQQNCWITHCFWNQKLWEKTDFQLLKKDLQETQKWQHHLQNNKATFNVLCKLIKRLHSKVSKWKQTNKQKKKQPIFYLRKREDIVFEKICQVFCLFVCFAGRYFEIDDFRRIY